MLRARLEGTGPLGNRPATGSGTSHAIGTEVDLETRYTPARRVLVFGLFGWFAPGAVYSASASDALQGEVGMAFRF